MIRPIVLALAVIALLPTPVPDIRAQQSSKSKENQVVNEPTHAELTTAINAHIENAKKKTYDHRFHASLGTFEGSIIGGIHAPETRLGSARLMPVELREHVDPMSNQDVTLEFVDVRGDRLCHVNTGATFVCVDMRGTDGNRYDVDFFFTGSTGRVDYITALIHKINGKERYHWKQENGQWKVASRTRN